MQMKNFAVYVAEEKHVKQRYYHRKTVKNLFHNLLSLL